MVEGGDTRVTAKHIVIAAGSRAFIPPIKGLAETPYLTNESVFENRTLPDHLIVIGGGPIGVELAQAHRRLGAKATIIEGGPSILPKDDPELVDVVRAQLTEDGVNIIEGALVEEVSHSDGVFTVRAGDQTLTGSHVLVAAGRTPNVDGLNLEAAGVDYGPKGVKVDGGLRTSNKRVFAMGDIAGGRQFTHVAGYHASVLVRRILFKSPAKNNEHLAPWVTYADPELSHAGLTEAEARAKHGDTIKVARWEAEENDRASAERDNRGLIKVVTAKNGLILGASAVGKDAGELIQPWAYALANGQKIRSFTNYIAPYPTRGELSKRAAGAWYTPTLFSAGTRRIVSLLSMFD